METVSVSSLEPVSKRTDGWTMIKQGTLAGRTVTCLAGMWHALVDQAAACGRAVAAVFLAPITYLGAYFGRLFSEVRLEAEPRKRKESDEVIIELRKSILQNPEIEARLAVLYEMDAQIRTDLEADEMITGIAGLDGYAVGAQAPLSSSAPDAEESPGVEARLAARHAMDEQIRAALIDRQDTRFNRLMRHRTVLSEAVKEVNAYDERSRRSGADAVPIEQDRLKNDEDNVAVGRLFDYVLSGKVQADRTITGIAELDGYAARAQASLSSPTG